MKKNLNLDLKGHNAKLTHESEQLLGIQVDCADFRVLARISHRCKKYAFKKAVLFTIATPDKKDPLKVAVRSLSKSELSQQLFDHFGGTICLDWWLGYDRVLANSAFLKEGVTAENVRAYVLKYVLKKF